MNQTKGSSVSRGNEGFFVVLRCLCDRVVFALYFLAFVVLGGSVFHTFLCHSLFNTDKYWNNAENRMLQNREIVVLSSHPSVEKSRDELFTSGEVCML